MHYKVPTVPVKTDVVEQLEKESSKPRTGTMRMPKEKVKWIEYLIDKYGDDYDVILIHISILLSADSHYLKIFVVFRPWSLTKITITKKLLLRSGKKSSSLRKDQPILLNFLKQQDN